MSAQQFDPGPGDPELRRQMGAQGIVRRAVRGWRGNAVLERLPMQPDPFGAGCPGLNLDVQDRAVGVIADGGGEISRPGHDALSEPERLILPCRPAG